MKYRTLIFFSACIAVGHLAKAVARQRHEKPGEITQSLQCLPTSAKDEIWLVSTRCLGECAPYDESRIVCRRFQAGQWREESLDSLRQSELDNSDCRTIVYVHGNRTDLEWSAARGLQVFEALFERNQDRRAVRMIIWSWPADPHVRRLKEYRQNSRRSVAEADHLASFLLRMNLGSTVGLIGYSFGSQTVVSATEQICESPNPVGINLQIALIAPALQWPWIDRDVATDTDASCVAQIVRLDNSIDRALRFNSGVIHLRHGRDVSCCTVCDLDPNTPPPQIVLDVGDAVGSKHAITRYLCPDWIRQLVSDAVLNDPADTESVIAGSPLDNLGESNSP